MVCYCKVFGLQILWCVNIYDHRPCFWSWIHSVFDEGGNKIFEIKLCIVRWIESNKIFWRILSINIDIDWLTSMEDWQRPSNEGSKFIHWVKPPNQSRSVSVAGKGVSKFVSLNAWSVASQKIAAYKTQNNHTIRFYSYTH